MEATIIIQLVHRTKKLTRPDCIISYLGFISPSLLTFNYSVVAPKLYKLIV